eukprot:COSAG02_NODE_16644_length_1067_cov_2.420455_1_plen_78_part_10
MYAFGSVTGVVAVFVRFNAPARAIAAACAPPPVVRFVAAGRSTQQSPVSLLYVSSTSSAIYRHMMILPLRRLTFCAVQ